MQGAWTRRSGGCATMLGRRRAIPDISRATLRGGRWRADGDQHGRAGSAADLIKLAMVDIHRELERARERAGAQTGAAVRMLLQVHDRLVFSARPRGRKGGAFVVERMERAASA